MFHSKNNICKKENKWKIFWFKSDGKWHGYEPKPTVKSIKEFIKIIEDDKFGCFCG